ncbi:MAG TPA: ABC transporter substrate-binding protein [Stellaceae bacterium]|nr:ABC transporter substrate-binding protein [Stellaceae bacterium]
MSRKTAFAAALVLALIGLPRPGAAAEAIVLQLSAPAQFEFAGYYAALWQGYYRDAGFDVTIRPGGLRDQIPIDPVRELAEGRAQFGIGTTRLVIRRAQGLPVLLVAPIFQQSGAAVYYRADSDFSSPAALVNARLGRLAASDILDIELATALRAEGIDPARIKSITLDRSRIVTSLADRTVDAAIGSAWTVPWEAHERGLVLKAFNPASYRVEYYGDSLFTMERLEIAEPDTVRRFRAASLKGWDYALQHPAELITRLAADKTAAPAVADLAGFNRYQADVARRLSRYPDIPLGYANVDRWTQIEAGMIGAGVLERNADLSGFIYQPGRVAPERGGLSRRLIALLAAGLGAAAAGAVAWYALVAWRRRAPRDAAAPRPQSAARAPVLVLHRAAARPAPSPSPPQPTELNAVLGPLERRIRQRVRGKVRCRYSLLEELWSCRTEGGTVAGMVLDLVDAAIAVMDSDGTLIVGTRNFAFDENNVGDYPGARLGQFARITVRDSGPGLSDAEFAQIADPETTTRPAVAKAAAAMARLGGFLRVESAEGVGTAVHLYFVRVGEGLEEVAAADAPAVQVAE